MTKDKCVKLTEVEIRHILSAIYGNSEDDDWKDRADIALKLEEALDDES